MTKIKEIKILEPKIKEIKKTPPAEESEPEGVPSDEDKENIEKLVEEGNLPIEENKADLKKLILESDIENKERNLEEVLRDVPVEKKDEKKDSPVSGLYGAQNSNLYGASSDLYSGSGDMYKSAPLGFEGVSGTSEDEKEERLNKYNSIRRNEQEKNAQEDQNNGIIKYSPRR